MMFFSTRDPEKKFFKASEVIKNGLAADGIGHLAAKHDGQIVINDGRGAYFKRVSVRVMTIKK